MKHRFLPAATVFLALLPGPPNCSAAHIAVRVLDVRDTKPIADQKINLQFHVSSTTNLQQITTTTGADGVAVFDLPKPMPRTISVNVENSDLYPCASQVLIDVEQVTTSGLVLHTNPPYCKFTTHAIGVRASAGELVIFMRPLHWYERFLRHVWE